MDAEYLQSLKKLTGSLQISQSGLDSMVGFDYTEFPLTPSQALYIMSIKEERLVYQRNILQLLGYHEDEFNFDNVFNLMHRDDRPIVETILKNTLTFSYKHGMSEKATLYLTYRMRKKDGSYIKIQRISGVCRVTDSNALEWNYSILQDVSYMQLSSAVRWNWDSPTLNKEAYQKYIQVLPQDLFSSRELEIYHCIMDGLSGPETAKKLNISANTVKSHKHKMAQKVGVATSAELIDYFENKAFQQRPWQ